MQQKFQYDKLIMLADNEINKGIFLDKNNKFQQAKAHFKKAGELCFKAYKCTQDNVLKNMAYKKYKTAESYYYAMDFRKNTER